MNHSAFFRRRFGMVAFTLVELLVVIAIIAILAGILLPVMAVVRSRGDSAACVSNLRQIGVAIAAYANENDNLLPGPLASGQMPTYSSADTTSLAELLTQYLRLPPATSTPQKAPIMICPSYAKADPALDQPVYAINEAAQAGPPVWPFGDSGSGTKPMKLAALSGLIDSTGNPLSPANIIALRDFTMAGATLATTTVTWNSPKPVHGTYLNALYFDWHVAEVDPATLQPK